MMRPDATIVTSGGFLGEPIVHGIARGDAHVDVWSDSSQTDGFVYQKVLEAAQSLKSRKSR